MKKISFILPFVVFGLIVLILGCTQTPIKTAEVPTVAPTEAPVQEAAPTAAGTPITVPPQVATAPSGPQLMQVRIQNSAFEPEEIQIKVGDAITWKQMDNVPHTVTGDGGLDSPTLRDGEEYSQTFNKPGRYTYSCSIHPGMKGVVEVTTREPVE